MVPMNQGLWLVPATGRTVTDRGLFRVLDPLLAWTVRLTV